MPEQFPPLRIREADGSPNTIPVFDIILSDNLTMVNRGNGIIAIVADSGGDAVVYSATGNQYVTLALAGDLTAERTLTAGMGVAILDSGANSNVVVNANTSLLVTSGRSISTVYPISGGGNLSLNREFAVDTAFLVNSGRTISTAVGLSGGANLSADRTLVADTLLLVTTGRTLSAGSGLTGGGDLSADRSFSVNTNVRDKQVGLFYSGNLATAMLGEESRIYIPFNMELRAIRLAVTTSATGANIIVNPLQFMGPLTSSTALFASANRPIIVTNNLAGSDNGTIAVTNLIAGSWLGCDVDQVGSTVAGSNLTVIFLMRTS